MVRTEPFEKHALQYEGWFERNRFAYESELAAIKQQLPKAGNGVEIGVGSGRFAEPLGIKIGIDPSKKMREIAQERGIEVIDAVAEVLPFGDCQFDFALMVTTICFVDDIDLAFKEAYRILRPGGSLVVGFVDRSSPLGNSYQEHKNESKFYKTASFYSVDEVVSHLSKAGFGNFIFTQTIFRNLSEMKQVDLPKPGYGQGSFVVVGGKK